MILTQMNATEAKQEKDIKYRESVAGSSQEAPSLHSPSVIKVKHDLPPLLVPNQQHAPRLGRVQLEPKFKLGEEPTLVARLCVEPKRRQGGQVDCPPAELVQSALVGVARGTVRVGREDDGREVSVFGILRVLERVEEDEQTQYMKGREETPCTVAQRTLQKDVRRR